MEADYLARTHTLADSEPEYQPLAHLQRQLGLDDLLGRYDTLRPLNSAFRYIQRLGRAERHQPVALSHTQDGAHLPGFAIEGAVPVRIRRLDTPRA